MLEILHPPLRSGIRMTFDIIQKTLIDKKTMRVFQTDKRKIYRFSAIRVALPERLRK